MLYLKEEDLKTIGVDWSKCIAVIEKAVKCMDDNDFAQPIKPYLRYDNPQNRIIAMPAYVGGGFRTAGLKWIASFPNNINKGLPRAHSLVVLNDAETGVPSCVINSPYLSIIRTAAVSGMVLKRFIQSHPQKDLTVGICGFGPIGQFHYQMCRSVLGDRIKKMIIYDPKLLADRPGADGTQSFVEGNSWEEAYENADLFFTCTVAPERYIDIPPKRGSLHFNVSLRDYKLEVFDYFKENIIVDDWEEICRENTDIEQMHLYKGLTKNTTKSIVDILYGDYFENNVFQHAAMFNPMGMAVFDMALGDYYRINAKKLSVGIEI